MILKLKTYDYVDSFSSVPERSDNEIDLVLGHYVTTGYIKRLSVQKRGIAMPFLLDKGDEKVILGMKGEKLANGFLDRHLRFKND